MHAIAEGASTLAHDTRGISCPANAVDSCCLGKRGIRGTAVTHGVYARAAQLRGTCRRRAANGENSNAATRGAAYIAKSSHAREGAAATALNAVGIPAPSLPINASWTDRIRIGPAPNAPHPCTLRTTASPEYAGAVTVRVAEAGHTREIPAAEALHAIVGSVCSRIADNAGTHALSGSASALAKHSFATITSAKALDAYVVACPKYPDARWERRCVPPERESHYA
jgi:hypothetical protein